MAFWLQKLVLNKIYIIKHIVGFVDFILNKQATHLHFFHSYVLPKFNSVYTRVLHFYPGFELKNYTSVYTRLGLYAIIYGNDYSQENIITKFYYIKINNVL